MDRRAFLARGAAAGGGVALTCLTNRLALADMRTTFRSSYGAPVRAVDQLGRNILALPPDFSYVTFGEIGSPMSDGAPTPLALDGMAAFRGPCGTVRLIRKPRGPQRDRGRERQGRRGRQVRPAGGRGHRDARLRPAHADARAQLRLARRHDGQLRRRPRPAPPQLAERRGDDRGTGGDRGGWRATRSATATCSRCRSTARSATRRAASR